MPRLPVCTGRRQRTQHKTRITTWWCTSFYSNSRAIEVIGGKLTGKRNTLASATLFLKERGWKWCRTHESCNLWKDSFSWLLVPSIILSGNRFNVSRNANICCRLCFPGLGADEWRQEYTKQGWLGSLAASGLQHTMLLWTDSVPFLFHDLWHPASF